MPYKTPKIMLIDLNASILTRLESEGYSVRTGTFGTPYKAVSQQGHKHLFVQLNHKLPNLPEQDILFIDTSTPLLDVGPFHIIDETVPDAGYSVIAPDGIVDPRPVAMLLTQGMIDRILDNCGVVVLFVSYQEYHNFHTFQDYHSGYVQRRQLPPLNNFGFTDYLSCDFAYDPGEIVNIVNNESIFTPLFKQHLDAVHVNNTFTSNNEGQYPRNKRCEYIRLLTNKFGSIVGSATVVKQEQKESESSSKFGLIILLPQFQNKNDLILSLLRDILPNTNSHLFPEHEGATWIFNPAYEHPTVLKLHEQIAEIERESHNRRLAIQKEVESERVRLGFLHGLLTASGDLLVDHVIHALRYLGFKDVIDADKQLEKGINKEEDIGVKDSSPKLLFEVKGLGGLPNEADTQQLTKFLSRRKTSWRTTDIRGVFLVNHNLGVKPHDRNNATVYTDAQIRDAKLDHVALMTTWDLFKLIRGMDRWSWPSEIVRESFYEDGRAGLLPSHWTPLGHVNRYFDNINVVVIELQDGQSLKVGDTIGLVVADNFEQEVVETFRVNELEVSTAGPGGKVSLKTRFSSTQLPKRKQIYLANY